MRTVTVGDLRNHGNDLPALAEFDISVRKHEIRISSLDLVNVFDTADRLSKKRTISGGYRSFDILIVSSALALGATAFLTFDKNQRKLALAENLTCPLDIT